MKTDERNDARNQVLKEIFKALTAARDAERVDLVEDASLILGEIERRIEGVNRDGVVYFDPDADANAFIEGGPF